MKTKTSLLLASTFSAIALFAFVPARAEDTAVEKQDTGKKGATECHEGSGCGNGVCPFSGDKQDAEKKQQETDKSKPAAPSSSNQ